MHTSVAPSCQASSARSRDLVEGQRVRVGVGAALGERAEPAAGVADVGEVDVPVDDVGDVVADRRRPAARRPARRPRRARRRRRQQRQRLLVGQIRPDRPRPPAARRRRRRRAAAERADLAPATTPSRRRRPVEVVAPVGGAAVGVDRGVQVGPPDGEPPPSSRLLPGRPTGSTSARGEPGRRVGERVDVRHAAAGPATARRR